MLSRFESSLMSIRQWLLFSKGHLGRDDQAPMAGACRVTSPPGMDSGQQGDGDAQKEKRCGEERQEYSSQRFPVRLVFRPRQFRVIVGP
jgi:hypothetical protein